MGDGIDRDVEEMMRHWNGKGMKGPPAPLATANRQLV